MRHGPATADIVDGGDDGMGILQHRVVQFRRGGSPRIAVIHAEAATHVQVLKPGPPLHQRRIDLCRLPGRALQPGQIGDLASQVEVQQPQLREDVGRLFKQHQQIGHGQAELGVRQGAPFPSAGGPVGEPDTNSQRRLNAAAGRDGPQYRELLRTLHHRDDLPAEALGIDRHGQHRFVLDAVAHQQTSLVGQMGQGARQLGPGPAFKAHAVLPARVHYFRDHVAQWIDLDRIQGQMAVPVTGPGYRGLKITVQARHLGTEYLREPNHQRRFNPPAPGFLDDRRQVDGTGDAGVGADCQMSAGADGKVRPSPASDSIKFTRVRDGPGRTRYPQPADLGGIGHQRV